MSNKKNLLIIFTTHTNTGYFTHLLKIQKLFTIVNMYNLQLLII